MSRRGSSVLACAVAAGAALLFGCAGGRTEVVAPTSEYVISLSDGIRDSDGTLVADPRKKVVGQIREDDTKWAMFFTALKLGGDVDISQTVNQQVKEAGGDAVINLAVTSENCKRWTVWTFLSILPDCVMLHVRGNIIKVGPAGAVATTATPPAAPGNTPATPKPSQP